jgi:hypothetical protein
MLSIGKGGEQIFSNMIQSTEKKGNSSEGGRINNHFFAKWPFSDVNRQNGMIKN